jgi:hypothetical protein
MVDVVWQRWASGGFLAFMAATLAQRLVLIEGMVDGRNLTERFIWLSGTASFSSLGRHHGSSPIPCGLQVKTWSGSLGRMTVGLVLRNLLGDVVFKTFGRFLLGSPSGSHLAPWLRGVASAG